MFLPAILAKQFPLILLRSCSNTLLILCTKDAQTAPLFQRIHGFFLLCFAKCAELTPFRTMHRIQYWPYLALKTRERDFTAYRKCKEQRIRNHVHILVTMNVLE